jgi:NHL repeat
VRVGLRASAPPPAPTPPPLLAPGGPRAVLGGHDPFAGPLAPSATSLYGPRAALVADGRLWVSDTGHHRVLGWSRVPDEDGVPADVVLGQPSFASEARAPAGPGAMNMPTGLAALPGGGLAVCDSWNNRVLVWRRAPESGAPPDLVLGQRGPDEGRPNRGRDDPRADTLFWPFAALVHGGALFVADAGNRRVVVFDRLPTESGAPADRALGQPSLEERSDNGGGPADARSLRWPHALAVAGGDLAVADAGNNRVLVYRGAPAGPNEPAALVLGQADFAGVDHNAGAYDPTARTLNMPYGLAASGRALYVADTANSRLLGYGLPLTTFAEASALAGQGAFTAKGDNRWRPPARDSLCWPYGLTLAGGLAVVADTGNHRVALWEAALG